MSQPRIWLGVSLKMYFSFQQTLAWSQQVAEMARQHPAIISGDVGLFVLPAFPAIAPVISAFAGTPVVVGAQDLHWEDSGAWTGEVSGSMLAEMGCGFAEVAHAERRRHLGEDDTMIAAKLAASLRNGLTPVLCLGEPEQGSAAEAIAICRQQLEAALQAARSQQLSGHIVLAYEPQWAIGAATSAPDDFIGEVCAGLRQTAGQDAFTFSVIYGGSAGPGLLTRLGDRVGGLFLGRFAHQPAALASIIDEAAALAQQAQESTWQSV